MKRVRTLHLKLVSVPEPLEPSDYLQAASDPTSAAHHSTTPAWTPIKSRSLAQVMDHLAHRCGYRVLWINRDDEISLSDLQAAGIELTKLTFAFGANAFSSLKNSLQSARHPILIAPKNELTRSQLSELEPLLKEARAELLLVDSRV